MDWGQPGRTTPEVLGPNKLPWKLQNKLEQEEKGRYVIRIHESHISVLRKIHFKQMKIIAVYTQLKQLRK